MTRRGTVASQCCTPPPWQVRTRLYSSAGPEATLLWSYRRCSASEFSDFFAVDTVACVPCPPGGDCSGASLVDDADAATSGVVVTQVSVAAQPGFWASNAALDLTFYECPISAACLPGANGSRSVCAAGYTGVLCSVCDDGYFEQFGSCVACPTTKQESVGSLVGLSLLLLACVWLAFLVRAYIPVDVLKLGLSMLQVRCLCTL